MFLCVNSSEEKDVYEHQHVCECADEDGDFIEDGGDDLYQRSRNV